MIPQKWARSGSLLLLPEMRAGESYLSWYPGCPFGWRCRGAEQKNAERTDSHFCSSQ